ncbi:MAG TPA: glycosyltransferase family 9 protein [Methylibium sp.]|uniref:glycosyltransferase family 9 protein n=1 Tax=Methylibium sp. TaxID=2067992 RepID=UPI002DBF0699|nr:glycosyltransferase family 9 protein [Methylibium sp.]HEU4459533.1 glycosyltransferase family 9 protein [Methylibium sp.]
MPDGTAPGSTVLIFRIGSLGDTVVALPCLHRIAQCYATSRRVLLTNVPVSTKAAPAQAVVGGVGLIDDYLAYPVGLRSPAGLWRLARQIRALAPSALVYLMPTRSRLGLWRDLSFFKLCGVPSIVGAPLAEDLRRNRRDAGGLFESEGSRLARCLAPLGAIDLADRALWDLRLTADERANARRVCAALGGRPFLAINMGGKIAIKDWGVERWQALLGELRAARPGFGLLVVGAPEDHARGADAAARWGEGAVNACGALTPRESAAAMESAAAFVGHDSGPMHLAAAVGVRCVGLFGSHEPPALWHPIGVGHTAIHRMAGVETIGVAEVRAAVLATLAQPEPVHAARC